MPPRRLGSCGARAAGDDAGAADALRGSGRALHRWVSETLRACLGEIEPPLSAADGLAALRVVHAAYASAAHGSLETVA